MIGRLFTYKGTVAEMGYGSSPLLVEAITDVFQEFNRDAVRVRVMQPMDPRDTGFRKFAVGVEFTAYMERLTPVPAP